MLIARDKRQTNIAEYILYIWQVEDIIRALNFDLDEIGNKIVSQFDVDDDTKLEIYQWYKNLVLMMQKEQVTEKGHVQFIINIIDDLYRFHLRLLQTSTDSQYLALYQVAHPLIEELRSKSDDSEANEILIAFQALYSIVLLKLQNKTITQETNFAIDRISKLVGHLSGRYKQFEDGEFEI